MCEKECFLNTCNIYNRNSYVYIWYMVASWTCITNRDFFSASLCEDFSDLTSPTSNHYTYSKSAKIYFRENNYMQISGKKSWILEFDLFLIIY